MEVKYDHASEAALLAALLHEPGRLVEVPELKPDDFFSSSHRKIFSAIRALEDPDLLGVRQWLSDECSMEPGEAGAIIESTYSHYVRNLNIKYHASRLRDFRWRRDLAQQAEMITQYASNGVTSSELHDMAKKLATMEPEEREEVVASLDLGALLTHDLDPIPWIVPGWLAEGDIAVLAGEPKTGKSWLALLLTLRVSRGLPWLGIDTGLPRRVMYIDEEQNPRLVKHRVKKLSWSSFTKAEELSASPIRYLTQNNFNLDEISHRTRLMIEIRRWKPDLIIIDTLKRVHRRDENSNSEMSAFFSDVIMPMSETGAAVLLLHHLRKQGANESGDATHRVRGAGDLVAAVGSIWTLEGSKQEGLTLTVARSRWAEAPEPIVVSIKDSECGRGVTIIGDEVNADIEAAVETALLTSGEEGLSKGELITHVIESGASDAAREVVEGAVNRALRRNWARYRKYGHGRSLRHYHKKYAPPGSRA